jgi:hypothetical protein
VDLLSVIEARRGLYVGATLALVVGCMRESTPAPSTLIDGSPVHPSSITFDGVDGPLVATRVRVVPAGSRDERSLRASCVRRAAPSGPVVERTGVSGVSLTYLDPGHRGVHACDATDLDGSGAARWCAHAFGRLSGGRLRDPRLTITCGGADGEPVGFAWVQPGAAAYVVVQQSGHAEIYAAAGTTPVRVTTSDIDVASSRAKLVISEHTSDGRRLRSYELEAQVAS